MSLLWSEMARLLLGPSLYGAGRPPPGCDRAVARSRCNRLEQIVRIERGGFAAHPRHNGDQCLEVAEAEPVQHCSSLGLFAAQSILRREVVEGAVVRSGEHAGIVASKLKP